VLILLGIPPLGVNNQNTVGENGGFKLTSTGKNISDTVSNTATVTIITINKKSHIVDLL